jgi:CheY-like chemotaxis protein
MVLKPILFAEDNDLDAELTLAALGELNVANAIIRVRDGAEALDFLFKRGDHASRPSPDPLCILLDLKMPRVDGLEVLRAVKQDGRLRAIPIVMLTSSREEQDLVRSYQLGVNAYVVKPVDASRFSGAVREIGAFWALLNEVPPETTGP